MCVGRLKSEETAHVKNDVRAWLLRVEANFGAHAHVQVRSKFRLQGHGEAFRAHSSIKTMQLFGVGAKLDR
jgi:hypothetical protein